MVRPRHPALPLMNAQAKAHRLEMLGVDTLFELPFDAPLASLSPEDFVHRRPRPRPRPLPRGRRRRLPLRQGPRGLGRDVPRPRPRGGLEVTIAPMVELEGSEVSSTAIRQASPRATRGRPRGCWATGTDRGAGDPRRPAGPDAGLPHREPVHRAPPPAPIRHLCRGGRRARRPPPGSWHGAASIGVRPMFGTNQPNCETFLFDFAGDLTALRCP
jgi:riboflavin kinase/FMN adenylyltransferase